jgi:hypothetical protein
MWRINLWKHRGREWHIRLGLFAALMPAVLLFAGWAVADTRVALVVGNGAYQHVPVLPNPENDASDVAASLERLGFSVRRVVDGKFEDMRRALLEFSQRVRGADIAMMYFAGHGMEIGSENWLIPIDAELKSDLDVEQEAVGLKSIMSIVSAASRLGLVVLDACRNNPFAAKMQRTGRTRAADRGLTRVEPNGSVLVAYAARDGTTAADGSSRNSPFTAALLRYIETPGLEVNFLFRAVRDDVLRTTKREQEPFVYGALSKEAIYLRAPPPVLGPPSADEVMWDFLKDTSDTAALRRFVEQFPTSARRADAEQRLSMLAADAEQKLQDAAKADRRELARLLQLELRRVGCFDGAINGEFDDPTRSALVEFAKQSAAKLTSDELSPEAVKAVRDIDKRVCPLVCPAGERPEGERCVRLICPAGQVLKDGSCMPERAATDAGTRTAPPPKGGGSSKCFTFQGRQFCE